MTFSVPVVDPVISIWSLGQLNSKAVFLFEDAKPTLVAGGPNGMFGGSALTVLGNEVSGNESNGTIQFHGIFSSLSWTNPVAEDWYGITVGAGAVAAVPEPESYALMLGGLGALGLLAGRRRVER